MKTPLVFGLCPCPARFPGLRSGILIALLLGITAAADDKISGEIAPEPDAPRRPVEAWARVTDTAKLICGGVPNASYDMRIKAVRLIGKSVPTADFETLANLLNKDPKDDPATPDEFNAIRNDVAGRLLACEHLPDDFSKKFLSMVDAPHVGSVWQNYTVQFLDTLWQRENNAGMRKQIFNKLLACTRDTRLTIPGTAILTLSRLPAEAGLSQRELADIAMRIVNDEKIAWQDKISAIQVAAQTGDTRALAEARTWAAAEKLPVMQRMSALAVLGLSGDAGDKPLLEKYAKTGEFRLRSAARSALKKIDARILISTAENTDKNTGAGA